MVTAKYTESTPIQPVDFTAAAGAGAEGWAKLFATTENLAYQKGQQLADAQAAQNGVENVAKYGLGAPYPDSSSEAAQHYKQAVDRSQATLLQNQINSKGNELFQETAAQGFNPQTSEEFNNKWTAWTKATLDGLPQHQKAMGLQLMGAVGNHYGMQVATQVSKQLLQDKKLQSDLAIQEQGQHAVNYFYQGGQFTNPKMLLGDQSLLSSLKDNILNAPGTALQREAKLRNYQENILQANVTGSLQWLQQAQVKALQETNPEKRAEKLAIVKKEYNQIQSNPQKWVKGKIEQSDFFEGVNPQAGLTALKTFKNNMMLGLAQQSQQATDTYDKLTLQIKNGNIPTQAGLNEYVNQAPYDKKGVERVKSLSQGVATVTDIFSEIATPGALDAMLTKANKGTYGDSKYTNAIAKPLLDKLNTLKMTNPAAYGAFIYNRSSLTKQTQAKAYAQLRASPEQVQLVEGFAGSPDMLTKIASGQNPLNLAQDKIANQYYSGSKNLQRLSGIPEPLVSTYTNEQYKSLNTYLQSLTPSERIQSLTALYQTPSVNYMEMVNHLKATTDVEQALLVQGDSGDNTRRVSDLLANPDMLKAAKDSLSDKDKSAMELAAHPHLTTLYNTFPPHIAKALANIYRARAYMTYQGTEPGFTTGLGLRRHSITWESGSDALLNDTLTSLHMYKFPGQNIISSINVSTHGKTQALDPFIVSRNLEYVRNNVIDGKQFYTPPTYAAKSKKEQTLIDQARVNTFIPSITPTQFWVEDSYTNAVKGSTWSSITPTKVQLLDMYGAPVFFKDKNGKRGMPVMANIGDVQTMMAQRGSDGK